VMLRPDMLEYAAKANLANAESYHAPCRERYLLIGPDWVIDTLEFFLN